MSSDRLNFFEPWEGLPAHHENQLTRALLVVLRYSPIAHQALLSLLPHGARSGEVPPLHELPKPEFQTQRRRILEGPVQRDEPVPGVSVLLAGDVREAGAQAVAERSGSDQVLDGIVRYGDRLVLVIESKLGGPSETQQHERINSYGQPVEFSGPPVELAWREWLAALSDLLDRDLVGGAERELVSDFLSMVDAYFPRLGPFNSLRQCAGHASRINRRLGRLMDGLRNTDTGLSMLDLSDRGAVKRAYLVFGESGAERPRIALELYPGDTLTQAKALYGRGGAVDRLLALSDEGWNLSPNLHFSFMATGVLWLGPTDWDIEEYLRYWQHHIDDLGQIPKDQMEAFWKRIVADGLADPERRCDFESRFVRSRRDHVNPCPGLLATYEWRLDIAERLDDEGRLEQEVLDHVNQVLVALGEPPL